SATSGEGGAIVNQSSTGRATLTITDSTLSTNSAGFFGGAIRVYGQPTLVHATLAAPLQPAAAQTAFQVPIGNSSFNGKAARTGDALYATFNARVTIGSTILSAGLSGINFAGSLFVVSAGYNLCSDNGASFLHAPGDQPNTPALLGPLQNNGGPTLTHAPLC